MQGANVNFASYTNLEKNKIPLFFSKYAVLLDQN